MTTTAKDRIDGYLGPGYHDAWVSLRQESNRERQRYRQYSARRELGAELFLQLFTDVDLLAKLDEDYARGMNLVANGESVSRDELDDVYELYVRALNVVRFENEVVYRLWAAGLMTALVLFPFALVQARATNLLDNLAVLEKALRKAKREVNEAWAQALLDTALVAVTTVCPQIGLIGKLASSLTQILADEILGTKKSPAAEVVDNVGDVAGPTLDVVEKVKRFGEKTTRIAGKAGKVVAVTGFVCDTDEIRQAYSNADALKRAMSAAKASYDELVKVIAKHEPKLVQLRRALQRVALDTRKMKEAAKVARSELESRIRTCHYPLDRPKFWVVKAHAE